jgi:holo-[acyl-carrier protein] synthase
VSALASGVDLVDVDRVRAVLHRHPDRFLDRYFTAFERDQCGRVAERVATRWAAKEAVAKALGTGFGPVGWREIEVRCLANGAPTVVLYGAAAQRASALGLDSWSLSLSHSPTQAVAFVVAIGG